MFQNYFFSLSLVDIRLIIINTYAYVVTFIPYAAYGMQHTVCIWVKKKSFLSVASCLVTVQEINSYSKDGYIDKRFYFSSWIVDNLIKRFLVRLFKRIEIETSSQMFSLGTRTISMPSIVKTDNIWIIKNAPNLISMFFIMR